MKEESSTGSWALVYKRGIFEKCMSCLQAVGMFCFATLFAAYIGFVIASLAGVPGLQSTTWSITKGDTVGNKLLNLLPVFIGGWLAYSSVKEFLKIVKDLFTRTREYEGMLTNVEERTYSGLRINYRMLALICTDTTWEIYPRLKGSYLLKPGRTIRVHFSGGTKTIKALWVLK